MSFVLSRLEVVECDIKRKVSYTVLGILVTIWLAVMGGSGAVLILIYENQKDMSTAISEVSMNQHRIMDKLGMEYQRIR